MRIAACFGKGITDVNHSFKIVALVALFLFRAPALAGAGDTSWMLQAKYGIFLHYQHRILLGYSHGRAALGTKPRLPPVTEMTAEGWNGFVDGFDARGFADQMGEGQVGWVLFCIDDHFDWPWRPTRLTIYRYAPARASRRDLIASGRCAAARGVKPICYYGPERDGDPWRRPD
jgi:hypothetical protein